MRLLLLMLCFGLTQYFGFSQISAISSTTIEANLESDVVYSAFRPGKVPLREMPVIDSYSSPPLSVRDTVPTASQAVDVLPDPIPCPFAARRKPQPDAAVYWVNKEHMPYLKACESDKDSARKKCAEEKMISFIYDNLVYPKEMESYEGKGMVIVQFVIEADGSISDEVKVLRSPAAPFSAEALRIVDLIKCTRGMEWMPGTQYGKAVAVTYNVPIKFKPGGGNPYK